MRRFLVVALLVSASQAFGAASDDDISLFCSWRPKGQPWHFSFFPRSHDARTAEDLKHPRVLIVGVPSLKKHLLRFKRGDNLVWGEFPGAYPPIRVVDDIVLFADRHGIHIDLNPVLTE